MDFGTSMNSYTAANEGVYEGHGAIPLTNHPHFSSGRTVIENRKAIGEATRLAGTGFEYQVGHNVPSTTYEYDVTAHNILQPLKTFFANGYSLTANPIKAYFATFKKYTNPNPDRFMSLVRKFSDASADSHRMWGCIATSIAFSAKENTALHAAIEFSGASVIYNYTWTTSDSKTFDTALDPLLWKNAHIAIGTIVEGFKGSTCAIGAGDDTFVLSYGAAVSGLIEPGAYIVFESAPNTKYGPIKTVTATGGTLETGTGPTGAISATPAFKIMNLFHMNGLDLTIKNNAAPHAYNEADVQRYILNDLTGSGNIVIPYSEIPAATGGTAPSYKGSAWLQLFLNAGVVRFHVWWGDLFDAVEDSIGDGDFGMSFNIKASGDGMEDDNGELGISVPFDMVADKYALGTVQAYAGAANHHAVVGTGTTFVAKGSDILAANSKIGVHRGDSIVVGTGAESEIAYVYSNTYLYLTTTPTTQAAGTKYSIHGEAIRIRLGVGDWLVNG
jgi:hypothetical protein